MKKKKTNLALSKIKALKFDKTYLVNVIFYIRNNPKHFDEQTGKMAKQIKPAFYEQIDENEKGVPYWTTDISDGVFFEIL